MVWNYELTANETAPSSVRDNQEKSQPPLSSGQALCCCCAWGDGSPAPSPAAARSQGPTSRYFSGAATYWSAELGIPKLLPSNAALCALMSKTDSLCGCVKRLCQLCLESNKMWVQPLGSGVASWISKGVFSLSATFFSSVASWGCLLTVSSLASKGTNCPLMTIHSCKISLFLQAMFCVIQQTECI